MLSLEPCNDVVFCWDGEPEIGDNETSLIDDISDGYPDMLFMELTNDTLGCREELYVSDDLISLFEDIIDE